MNGNNEDIITLGYGSGGLLSRKLINEHIFPHFSNPVLKPLSDGSIFPTVKGEYVFTTDSFVITPLFFPGGDIGKLAVCGTVNDLSVSFAKPLYLSCSFIIEEGLPFEIFDRVLLSMSKEAKKAGIQIITGDTKVVEKNKADKLFINTAGIGLRIKQPEPVETGDLILTSGSLGDHGMAVYAAREELQITTELKSDCASLNHMIAELIDKCSGIKFMRDTTRGGLSSALNEYARDIKLGITLFEKDIPLRREVETLCSMVGFDPLYVANEGNIVMAVSPGQASKALEIMHSFSEGKEACTIGKVTENFPNRVMLSTQFGGLRSVDMISGSQLPRIC